MEQHPALAPVAALIGVWEGTGNGDYPTLEGFSYREELTFTDIGKPFLAYRQRTWNPEGRPLHVETGYLRLPAPGIAEFVLAQPTGQAELCQGTVSTDEGLLITLDGTVLNSATAKVVQSTARTLRLVGDELVTTFDMAAAGQPRQRHLTSRLARATSR